MENEINKNSEKKENEKKESENKEKEYKEKIELVKKRINRDILQTQKKLRTSVFVSFTISILIILLNLTILSLASWALIELIKRIIDGKTKAIAVIMPTLVALFTIFLFFISIVVAILKIRNKHFFYEQILDEYQYLILKIKEKSVNIEETVDIINEINSKKFEYRKIKFSQIIRDILGGGK